MNSSNPIEDYKITNSSNENNSSNGNQQEKCKNGHKMKRIPACENLKKLFEDSIKEDTETVK